MKTYHKDVWMPEELLCRVPPVIKISSYSHHAEEKLEYYGVSKFWEVRGKVIEIEMSGNDIVKVLVRSRYDEQYDLVVAVGFTNNGPGFVKTVFMCRCSSHQKNLNRERYEQRQESIR